LEKKELIKPQDHEHKHKKSEMETSIEVISIDDSYLFHKLLYEEG